MHLCFDGSQRMEQTMSIFVKESYFYKRFFALTAAIALQNLIVFSVNLADNVMLGAYQESALSGVALVNQIQFLLQMLIMGIGEGMIILSSRYWGSRNLKPIASVTGLGLRLGLAVAGFMWLVVFLFPHAVLSLFTKEEAVIYEGVNYLQIICFSYFFFAVTNIMIATLRSVETVRIAFVVSFSTLIINVCLNYIFIFGHFGAPELGARGAAIATLTARIIETVIIFVYVKAIDRKLRLKLKDLLPFDKELFLRYLRVGAPVILSNAVWGIAMAVQTAILGHMGKEAIAANSIATTVFQILTVVTYGSASATAVLIGKTIGEGRSSVIREYAKTLQMLYLIIGIVTGLGLYFCKNFIIGFYAVSEETKALALQFMTVLSITVVGTAYQMPSLTGIVRSGGDTSFVLYNDLIFMWLIVLPSSALAAFVFHFSPLIVFICLKSDQILKCAVAVVKVNRYRWIRLP